MKKNIRNVNFYEIVLKTKPPRGIEITPTQEVFDVVLNEIYKNLNKKIIFGSKNNSFELVDFKEEGNNKFFLINKVDPNLPNVGFYKTSSARRRIPERDQDEFREQSSHVMIEPKKGTNVARLKLTTGAGTNAHSIKKILNDTYRKFKDNGAFSKIRERNWPTRRVDENGKEIKFKVDFQFEINPEPSELLQDILDHNKIVEIDLIDNRDLSLDESKYYIRKKTYTITGALPTTTEGILELLKLGNASEYKIDADHIRIVYAEEESDDAYYARQKINDESGESLDKRKVERKTRTLSIDEIEQKFTRSEKIYLKIDHAEIQTTLSEEIVNSLKNL